MGLVSVKGIIAGYITIFVYLYLVNTSYINALVNNIALGYYYLALSTFFSVLFNYSTGYELQTFLLWSFSGLVIGFFSKFSKRALVTDIIAILVGYILWRINDVLALTIENLLSESVIISLILSLFICGFASIIGVALSPSEKREKVPTHVPPLVDLEPKEGPRITPETMVATKTCPHCGATISATATYCPYCGKKVG